MIKNSKVVEVSRYGEAGREVHGKPPGTVMTVGFELDGQAFTALNGGPMFEFNEAISFQERAQQCGWLKDKYGGRVMQAMLRAKYTSEP